MRLLSFTRHRIIILHIHIYRLSVVVQTFGDEACDVVKLNPSYAIVSWKNARNIDVICLYSVILETSHRGNYLLSSGHHPWPHSAILNKKFWANYINQLLAGFPTNSILVYRYFLNASPRGNLIILKLLSFSHPRHFRPSEFYPNKSLNVFKPLYCLEFFLENI